MEKLKFKIVAILLVVILSLLIIPANVFAAEAQMQVVKSESGDYIIYVKEMADKQFQFAISTNSNASDSELHYINSVEDGEGNQVALVEKSKVTDGTNYIYVKVDSEITTNAIDFSENSQDVFDVAKMQKVESTTNRIETELETKLEERNEEVDGIQYTETVGGLKITDSQDATYYYQRVKLPAEKFSRLQELADILNSEEYMNKDMYSKIEFAKQFYNLYEELINNAEWTEVENMQIRQPIEAQKDDRYIVLLKKVSTDGTQTDDAKFLISYREDEEAKIPGKTETRVVQETAKLPITGDSIILFIVLAVIVIAVIIVFIRIKKLQNKGKQ